MARSKGTSAARSGDDVVFEIPPDRFDAAVQRELKALKKDRAALRGEASRQNFSSVRAKKLWGIIGGERPEE